jgi:hypothetical protein
MQLVGLLFASQMALFTVAADWQIVGNIGGVETYTKPDDPVTRTKAVRGTRLFANLHISNVLGVFKDVAVATQWVDMLSAMHEYDFVPRQCSAEEEEASAFVTKHTSSSSTNAPPSSDVQVVHQTYSFPWPIAPRDFLFLREFSFDEKKAEVNVYYESVLDDRVPVKDGVIRARNVYTVFRFKAVEAGTEVQVETAVDLKGTLPSVVINQIQKLWPMKTLLALERLSKKVGSSSALARVAAWEPASP